MINECVQGGIADTLTSIITNLTQHLSVLFAASVNQIILKYGLLQ